MALLGALLLILGGMVFISEQYTPIPITAPTPPQVPQLSPSADIQPPQVAVTDTLGKRLPAFIRQSLDSLSGHSSSEPALLNVLSIWTAELPADTTQAICQSALDLGLSCFQAELELAEIAHMNRPLAVNLGTVDLGDANSPRWVTLKQLDADDALLQVGDAEVRVARSDLAAAGRLDSIVLWRSPPNYQQPLKLGDSGTSVDALLNTLSFIDTGKPTGEVGFLFDLNLERRIKNFQRTSGIDPDGLVGARTWIQLNSIVGNDIPFLNAGVRH